MRAKRAKSRQGAWPDDRAIKEVHAEIPSTTAIDLVHESSMDCVISETEPDLENVNLLSPVSREFTTFSP